VSKALHFIRLHYDAHWAAGGGVRDDDQKIPYKCIDRFAERDGWFSQAAAAFFRFLRQPLNENRAVVSL
jgi:hypothetical protein